MLPMFVKCRKLRGHVTAVEGWGGGAGSPCMRCPVLDAPPSIGGGAQGSTKCSVIIIELMDQVVGFMCGRRL